jgi:hypothetical protein
MRAKRLTVQQRKEIFRALVTTQDGGATVSDSIRDVSQQFQITDAQLRQIQDEGIEKEWPPLDEVAQTVGEL